MALEDRQFILSLLILSLILFIDRLLYMTQNMINTHPYRYLGTVHIPMLGLLMQKIYVVSYF